ncbi:hypothetical protein K402DRAFT_27437 [Aulographum hederae CBS 113979]|uniref:Uncharacterized protein n=1 Tax=Aulographum hederae CBS 113979 TaxID=1176131 RepID=A0A6G1H6D0_9PEZI|nr:hypothetical protein K402DRAFT_27437 [Aulographum hederae CBS 113979]
MDRFLEGFRHRLRMRIWISTLPSDKPPLSRYIWDESVGFVSCCFYQTVEVSMNTFVLGSISLRILLYLMRDSSPSRALRKCTTAVNGHDNCPNVLLFCLASSYVAGGVARLKAHRRFEVGRIHHREIRNTVSYSVCEFGAAAVLSYRVGENIFASGHPVEFIE